MVARPERQWQRSKRRWQRKTSACRSSRWIIAPCWARRRADHRRSDRRQCQRAAPDSVGRGARLHAGGAVCRWAGTVLKNGGRVMKNVTGYDLVKLMTGSYGTLGVLSEVALKVLPRTDVVACIMIDGLSDAEAVRAMSEALGSPFEVSGAAHMPAGPTATGDDDADRRVRGIGRIPVGQAGGPAGGLWRMRGGNGPRQYRCDVDGDARCCPFHGVEGDVWRVSCKPSDGPHAKCGLSQPTLFDWGGGLIWALMPAGTDLGQSLGAYDGHATLVRAAQSKAHWERSSPNRHRSKRLRRACAPNSTRKTF